MDREREKKVSVVYSNGYTSMKRKCENNNNNSNTKEESVIPFDCQVPLSVHSMNKQRRCSACVCFQFS